MPGKYKSRKKKFYSTSRPKYNRYNEKTKKQQKYDAQVRRRAQNKNWQQQMRMPEYEETQKVYDKTLEEQEIKFKESYLNQWKQSVKDVSKIDTKLKQLLKMQEQRNVSEETKKKFNESLDKQKNEMKDNVEREYQNDFNNFSTNIDIRSLNSQVKNIPFAQRGRYYDAEKFRTNIKEKLINTTNGLLSTIQQNELFARTERRIAHLDKHLDEQIKLEQELLERDKQTKEIQNDLDKEIHKSDTLDEMDVFGSSIHKSMFDREDPMSKADNAQKKGDRETLLEKFKEKRIDEMLNIKKELNDKREQLQNEFKEVEKKIKKYYKEKDDFNQRMEEIQKEKMMNIEKCNELLEKHNKLIEDFDNNQRVKDFDKAYDYGLEMDKEEMEKQSDAILKEIQINRLKVHELSEKEDKEINEMNEKTKNINSVKENYDKKYRSLKNDLTKLEEDYKTYIENSESIEYQIDDLNYHDKESLTKKRAAIYEERQRKIAKNKEEESYKAPSLKDKFYHSMYNTLAKTTNKINKLKINILKDLKSGDLPLDISNNNIVARVYGEVLLEELKDELNAYNKTNAGSGKYSTEEDREFAKSVIERLEKTRKNGKKDDFINEYLMAKAMLDTCKRTHSSLKEGFENIENDLFKPKNSGFFSMLFGSKNKDDDDQTHCMKLMKNEFNIEKRVFSKNPKSSSGWFNFSLKSLFNFGGSKNKSTNSLLPVSRSTHSDNEAELITVKLKGPSDPIQDTKDTDLYNELKIKDAENPDLLMQDQHSKINHKLSFNHSAHTNLQQESQHKEVELADFKPTK